jgi:hypothetical protein
MGVETAVILAASYAASEYQKSKNKTEPPVMPTEQKAVTGTVNSSNTKQKKSTQTQDTILAGRLAQLDLDKKDKTKLGASQ